MGRDTFSSRDFTLGRWLVQPRRSQLRRGREIRHLTPRAMAVLVYLAEAGGAVVSRTAVLDAVWPRMAVTQDALGRCLVELRKAFGDGTSQPRVIETIPKVGIRLTLPVVWVEPQADQTTTGPRPRGVRWIPRASLAATLVLAAAGAGLWWVGRSATNPGGTVPTTNPRAREFFLSAGNYANRSNRLEALQYEETLYRRATEEDPQFALAWARLGRTHTGVYWYGLDRTPERLGLAERAIRRALDLDPALPEAHLYLANFYYKGRGDDAAALKEFNVAARSLPRDPELHFLRASVYRRVGEWQLAVRDGNEAIELDPENIVYRRQQHLTYAFMRDYARASQTLDRIVSLWPDDATAYVDKVVLDLCDSGDASLARQYERTPPTPRYESGLAYTYTRWLAAIFDRDYAKALAVLDAAQGDPVFNGDLRTSSLPKAALYARTHWLAGDREAARDEFESVLRDGRRALSGSPVEDVVATSARYLTLAEAEIALGDREAGLAAMAKARSLVPIPRDALSGSATQLASILRVLIPAGDTEAALRELDDYLARPGHWSIEGLLADPRLDGLRSEPGLVELVRKYRRQ